MHYLGVIVGIFISSLGLMFIFLYTNLLTLGYSFFDFVQFISTRIECLLFLFGLGLIIFSMRGWINSVLLLRHTSKFSR